MLPPGATAQPADPPESDRLRRLHPSGRTAVRLLVGACSCDFVRQRLPDPRDDERHHRGRHRQAGGTRDDLLAAVERHRRGAAIPAPPGGWASALAAFVAEHARNAGPTLYLVEFGRPGARAAAVGAAALRRVRASAVVRDPAGWLTENEPVIVEP